MAHKCGCNDNKEELNEELKEDTGCGCGCGCSDNEEKDGCGCSDHEGEDGCGCGHDHGGEDVQKIFITLNSGEELECSILGTFNVEEDEYIALLPDGSEEVFLYKFKLVDDEPELSLIESDDEYKKVSEVFLSLCDMGDE